MMSPLIRAAMSRIGTGAGLLNRASSGVGADMLNKAPDGRSWQEVLASRNQSPNARVAQGFGDMNPTPPAAGPSQDAAPKGGMLPQAPVDRIRMAFDAMREQHKNDPGPPMDLSKFGSVNVPDQTRPPLGNDGQPQQQQQAPQNPNQSPGFFMRNAMNQQDPESRMALDPAMAAKAPMGSPFSGLFG